MTALEDPRWLALSEERRDALLEKHRNTNVEHVDWYDSVYEQFDEQMAEVGIYVNRRFERIAGATKDTGPAIYFSGFWSQGDGACFEGHVDDWHKFLIAVGEPNLAELYLKIPENLHLSWNHSGHYYHSNCTSFTSDLYVECPTDEDDDPFMHGVWKTLFEDGMLFERHEDDFIAYVHGLMDELYKDLEKEYEYLTSDETVVEYILDHCEDELVEDEDEEEEVSLEH